jgi:magnesium chelatase family protein
MGKANAADQHLLVGELSLDGTLRPVRGVLSIAACARRRGIANVVVPADNAAEAGVTEGIRVFGLRHLAEVVAYLGQPERFEAFQPAPAAATSADASVPDFRDVRGQATAKRALEVAAAGGHNVLMIGPPGSGKSMLARRFAGILPPLTFQEALETTQIHSVAGLLPRGAGLLSQRPFRAPHHRVSDAGLIGGGTGMPRPGEVSLAHNGVLFLDELPEFPRTVLEVMRQPLEDGHVNIVRAASSVTFPARFMLAAAMNPCPCGYHNDPSRDCHCSGPQIQRYVSRISGPLLDRIDIHIDVPAVKYDELRQRHGAEESSARIRELVSAARERQLARFHAQRIFSNAQMSSRHVARYCELSTDCMRLLEQAMVRMGLSARAHDRILKVSRTIADLAGAETIEPAHISEAIQYRTLDRDYWA